MKANDCPRKRLQAWHSLQLISIACLSANFDCMLTTGLYVTNANNVVMDDSSAGYSHSDIVEEIVDGVKQQCDATSLCRATTGAISKFSRATTEPPVPPAVYLQNQINLSSLGLEDMTTIAASVVSGSHNSTKPSEGMVTKVTKPSEAVSFGMMFGIDMLCPS